LRWNDIDLFRHNLVDLGQHLTIVRTAALVFGYLVDDLDPWPAVWQRLAAAFLAVVRGDGHCLIQSRLSGSNTAYGSVDFGFIEQADLVRGQLLAAGGVTAGQGQMELFLEGKYLGVQAHVFLLECDVASELFSEQCLEGIDIIRQLGKRVWHVLQYTGSVRKPL
jgi:hypothetical protein